MLKTMQRFESTTRSLWIKKIQTRSLFSRRDALEALANEEKNAQSPIVQADLYKELLYSKNYSEIVQRFETQPQLPAASTRYPKESRDADIQRIQQDPAVLTAYVTALAKDGRIDRIVSQMSALIAPAAPSMKAAPGAKEYLIDMDRTQLSAEIQSIIKNAQKPRFKTQQEEKTAPSGPLHVVVSEAFSWNKSLRQLGSRLIYGLLLITGVSIFLEQQGLIKSGFSSGEPEPLTTLQTITFADVQGVDEAKHDLQEIVEFLKEPKKFLQVGGKLPKGVLLYGPPGTTQTRQINR